MKIKQVQIENGKKDIKRYFAEKYMPKYIKHVISFPKSLT